MLQTQARNDKTDINISNNASQVNNIDNIDRGYVLAQSQSGHRPNSLLIFIRFT